MDRLSQPYDGAAQEFTDGRPADSEHGGDFGIAQPLQPEVQTTPLLFREILYTPMKTPQAFPLQQALLRVELGICQPHLDIRFERRLRTLLLPELPSQVVAPPH